MTLEEVAEYLRVSERTVAEWAGKGELPGGKIGTTWRFRASDIEDWLNHKNFSENQKKDHRVMNHLNRWLHHQELQLWMKSISRMYLIK